MSTQCPIAYDHDEDGDGCGVCGWSPESARPQILHPDDMPTATGPDRVSQAIARDKGGWAPKDRVLFARRDESKK